MGSRSDIVVATFALHNIAVQNNLPLEEGPDVRVEENIPDPDHQDSAAAGQARRAEIPEIFLI